MARRPLYRKTLKQIAQAKAVLRALNAKPNDDEVKRIIGLARITAFDTALHQLRTRSIENRLLGRQYDAALINRRSTEKQIHALLRILRAIIKNLFISAPAAPARYGFNVNTTPGNGGGTGGTGGGGSGGGGNTDTTPPTGYDFTIATAVNPGTNETESFTVAITSPTAGSATPFAEISMTTLTLHQNYEVRRNLNITDHTTSPTTRTWTPWNLEPGEVTAILVLEDASGNRSVPIQKTFTITTPQTPPPPLNNYNASVQFQLDTWTNGEPPIRYTVTPTAGAPGGTFQPGDDIELRFTGPGSTNVEWTLNPNNTTTGNVPSANYHAGVYTITATLIQNGQRRTPTTDTITITGTNSTGPWTPVIVPTAAEFERGQPITFEVQPNEPGAWWQITDAIELQVTGPWGQTENIRTAARRTPRTIAVTLQSTGTGQAQIYAIAKRYNPENGWEDQTGTDTETVNIVNRTGKPAGMYLNISFGPYADEPPTFSVAHYDMSGDGLWYENDTMHLEIWSNGAKIWETTRPATMESTNITGPNLPNMPRGPYEFRGWIRRAPTNITSDVYTYSGEIY
jgi:hypothetical protein